MSNKERLVAWATPADHAKIRETIDGLDNVERPTDDRTVEAYAVAETDPTTLQAMLQAAAPDAAAGPGR